MSEKPKMKGAAVQIDENRIVFLAKHPTKDGYVLEFTNKENPSLEETQTVGSVVTDGQTIGMRLSEDSLYALRYLISEELNLR
jgi:hypothetical protein